MKDMLWPSVGFPNSVDFVLFTTPGKVTQRVSVGALLQHNHDLVYMPINYTPPSQALPGEIRAWSLPECPSGWHFLDGAQCPLGDLRTLLLAAGSPFGESSGIPRLPRDYRKNILPRSDWDETGYTDITGWTGQYATLTASMGFIILTATSLTYTTHRCYQDISAADGFFLYGKRHTFRTAVRDGEGVGGQTVSLTVYDGANFTTPHGTTSVVSSSEWQVLEVDVLHPETICRVSVCRHGTLTGSNVIRYIQGVEYSEGLPIRRIIKL